MPVAVGLACAGLLQRWLADGPDGVPCHGESNVCITMSMPYQFG